MKTQKQLKNNTTLIIRSVKESDAQDLINLLNKMGGETDYLSFGENGFPLSLEEEKILIKKQNGTKNNLMLLAEINGKPVGSLSLFSAQKERTKHNGEFGIAVLKNYWGFGIAKLLMDEMINWAKGNGVTRRINLKVCVDNKKAVKLYEDFGFEIEGKLKREICIHGKFIDNYIMSLLIN